MRRFPVLLAGLVLSACSGGRERPPHVIVISLDTLNRDALRAYDPQAVELPAIDAFAAESLRFDRAYSAASWTLPSHASLFTGLYPDRHGATDRRVTVAGVDTLAAGLARRGYQTAGFTGGGYLDAEYGMGRGFDRYESADRNRTGPSETGPQLVERVRGFLDERGRSSRPLFLFLHSYAIHNYYDVREEVAQLFPNVTFLDRKNLIDCVLGRGPCPDRAWRQMRRLYRAELRLFDLAFRDLVSALEGAGIWDEAIVIFLTDHGEGFEPERDRKHHGGRLHADQLHIPFLVRMPGAAPRAIDTPISLVDVMPTILELTGATVPDGIDGRSFAPVLAGEDELPTRPLYAMEHYFEWRAGRRFPPGGIRAEPCSMAVIDDDGWYIQGTFEERLFDPLGDPDQLRDLAATEGAALETLRGLLQIRMRARPETPLRGAAPGLDKALEGLGYVGEDDEE